MGNISGKLATSGAALLAAFAAGDAVAQTPVYNWSGFYIGAHAGYGWGTTNADGDKFNTKGVLGGLQAGYNWQLSSLVIGGEIDASLSGVKGKDVFFDDKSIKANQRWTGSARLRVGLPVAVSPSNSLLLYGTGGLAVSEWRVNIEGDKQSKTHFGWTAGAGGEMSLAPNFTVRLEYLYADYGKKDYFGGKIDQNLNVFRIGFNYKFAAPPP